MITTENIREKFENVLDTLNTLNDFCVDHDITFVIKEADNTSLVPDCISTVKQGFELKTLTQTIRKEL